jgi:cell division protease FtsH
LKSKNESNCNNQEKLSLVKKENRKQKMAEKKIQAPKGKNSRIWIFIVVLGILTIFTFFSDFKRGSNEIDFRKLKDIIENHDVEKIIIVNKERADIYLKIDKIKNYPEVKNTNFIGIANSSPQFKFPIGDYATFQKQLDEIQEQFSETDKIYLSNSTESNILGGILIYILPIIFFLGIWYFVFRRMSGGGAGTGSQIFSIGKSKAQVFDKEKKVKITFKDVAGVEEAKVEVMEIVDFLKNPKKYTTLGGKIPKGALLIGPPGTGKTLLAKAVAGEADVPFFSLSGSDFVEMFVGVGASRVRDLFQQAKSKAPCIIFIDEIDAIGRARGKNANFGGNDERENTLNQLLTEMDGFDTNSGVIILAATNRADILDSALLRAGRFDRQIHLELPDIKEREEIFLVHTKDLKMAETVHPEFLAKQTPGFSGADIANVCNEAALIAARNDKKSIEKQDFLDAVDRIIGGLEKKHKIFTDKEKKTIAYHEAGHATVSWLLEYANPLLKVTIIPRGKALGAAWYLPEERQITTKEQILDELCATLGGRASEEINFGEISTGALNDLERVTKQAMAIVTYFGMTDSLKNISYFDSTGQNEYGFTKPFSEKTAEIIDSEIKQIIEIEYIRAKKVLSDNLDGMKKLAERLLEKEVVFSDDLEEIFGKRKGTNVDSIQNDENNTENLEKEEIFINLNQ